MKKTVLFLVMLMMCSISVMAGSIDGSTYTAYFLDDLQQTDYHILNNSYITNLAIEGFDHNSTYYQMSGSLSTTPEDLSSTTLNPNTVARVNPNIQDPGDNVRLIEACDPDGTCSAQHSGSHVLTMVSGGGVFGGDTTRVNFENFGNSNLPDGFEFSLFVAPDNKYELFDFGLCAGTECGGGKKAYIVLPDNVAEWKYQTDVVAATTLTTNYENARWRYIVIRVDNTANKVDFEIWNTTQCSGVVCEEGEFQILNKIAEATSITYSGNIDHFYIQGWDYSGYYDAYFEDVVYSPIRKTGSYKSATNYMDTEYNAVVPTYSCSNCVVNITVDGTTFSNVSDGVMYEFVGSENTSVSYTIEFPNDAVNSSIDSLSMEFSNPRDGIPHLTAVDLPATLKLDGTLYANTTYSNEAHFPSNATVVFTWKKNGVISKNSTIYLHVTNNSVVSDSYNCATYSCSNGDTVILEVNAIEDWDNTTVGVTDSTSINAGTGPAEGVDFTDPCYSATYTEDGDFTVDLKIKNSCESNNYILWSPEIDLTILGNITDGEVIIGSDYMYVDSVLRPDLDEPATLVFTLNPYVIEPSILKDGIACGDCNVTQIGNALYVEVTGFSNYTLTGRQDFTVYSDDEPELKAKVYQSIDLGNSRRNEEWACIVQIFGRQIGSNDWVLVQTNPERQVQAKLLGNPDTNQPESLGYFPTVKGVANVYFRNDNLAGYMDLEYVAQCNSNSTSLLYEEAISTRYSPAGRTLTGRGVWLSAGNNAFYVTVWVVLALLALWIGGMIWRSTKY